MFLGSVVWRMMADHYSVRALPVDLPASSFSARMVTLKKRTLSPVVERQAHEDDAERAVRATGARDALCRRIFAQELQALEMRATYSKWRQESDSRAITKG
jgi:hypothetical protein